MTENDLKEFLFHSMRLWGDHTPNYHINLYFECEELKDAELEAFVNRLQEFFAETGFGELLLFGIHENRMEGDFMIRCSDIEKIRLTLKRLLPILEGTAFFEFGYAGLVIPTKARGYKKEIEFFGIKKEPREDLDEMNVEFPIPAGFELRQRKGFWSIFAKMFDSK